MQYWRESDYKFIGILGGRVISNRARGDWYSGRKAIGIEGRVKGKEARAIGGCMCCQFCWVVGVANYLRC